MVITIDPTLEQRGQDRATEEGLSVEAYIERLVKADIADNEELEYEALEGE